MTSIERKRELMRDLSTSLEELREEEKKLKDKRDIINTKIELLNQYDSFDKKDILNVIAYLISEIEEKDFMVKEYDINVMSSAYHIKNMETQYKTTYIVNKENESRLTEYLLNENKMVRNEEGEYVAKGKLSLESTLDDDDTIHLATYTRHTKPKVRFEENDSKDKIYATIKNPKFAYVNEYIERLLSYKLEKENISISFEEMKTLADQFISDYKDVKKLENKRED